ncbi:MAG: hypothetical protein IPL32_05220 [Chloracidobacterium sp.]|nr:hypothetical protein [Chloracidobacterium sp.]
MNTQPLIIGHRGASACAPENTLAAIQAALDAGVDGVEFDVQLACDKVPVVIHDPTLERTGSRLGNVSESTSMELGKIDVGSWFNSKYPERAISDFALQHVPTLLQVLELLENFQGLIYIELKPNKTNYRELVKAVCEVLYDSPLLPQIILKSFKLAVIPEIKQQLPNVQTAALFEPNIMRLLQRRNQIVTIAREISADQISLHHLLITKKFMLLTAFLQIPVTIWTTDDPKWVARSRNLGIRALITNDPAKLLKYR